MLPQRVKRSKMEIRNELFAHSVCKMAQLAQARGHHGKSWCNGSKALVHRDGSVFMALWLARTKDDGSSLPCMDRILGSTSALTVHGEDLQFDRRWDSHNIGAIELNTSGRTKYNTGGRTVAEQASPNRSGPPFPWIAQHRPVHPTPRPTVHCARLCGIFADRILAHDDR